MKFKYRQHIPGGIEVVEPREAEFNKKDDAIEYLKNQVSEGYTLCYSRNLVMEISKNGKDWWVLGYMDNVDELDLPKWESLKVDE